MIEGSIEVQWNIFLHIALAIGLGGLIGIEREWKQKPAGLRTNMIIAAASALFMSLGRVIVEDFSSFTAAEELGIDPTRVLHAVIVGVGFLGAGTILKSTDELKVKYLTTSATIWFAAGVGLTVGLKQYFLAIGISVLMLLVNILFDKVNSKVEKISKNSGKENE